MKSENNCFSLAEKIWANSFYPVYVPNVFYWPIEIPEEITQTGRKIMKDLITKTKLL